MIAISKLIKLLFGVFTKPIAAKAKGLSKSKDGVIRKILLNMGRSGIEYHLMERLQDTKMNIYLIKVG